MRLQKQGPCHRAQSQWSVLAEPSRTISSHPRGPCLSPQASKPTQKKAWQTILTKVRILITLQRKEICNFPWLPASAKGTKQQRCIVRHPGKSRLSPCPSAYPGLVKRLCPKGRVVILQQSPRWQSPKDTSRRVSSSNTKPDCRELHRTPGWLWAWLHKTCLFLSWVASHQPAESPFSAVNPIQIQTAFHVWKSQWWDK